MKDQSSPVKHSDRLVPPPAPPGDSLLRVGDVN